MLQQCRPSKRVARPRRAIDPPEIVPPEIVLWEIKRPTVRLEIAHRHRALTQPIVRRIRPTGAIPRIDLRAQIVR